MTPSIDPIVETNKAWASFAADILRCWVKLDGENSRSAKELARLEATYPHILPKDPQ